MAEYGIPYMGSKDKIAASLAINLPPAENFYDLFGGGFAMSHYMVKNKSHKYKYFHYNELKSDVVDLVKRSINGHFNYSKFKPKWVSRESFFQKMDNDAYVRCCWSFGNNQKDYLYSKEIEPYKKSMHQAVIFDEFDQLSSEVLGFKKWPDKVITVYQKRIYLRRKIENYRKTKIPEVLHQFLNSKQLQQLEQLRQLQQLERLQQLEQLQQLERLQQLEQLQRLNFYSKDYREIDILPNSVVYCDPPYIGTVDYSNHFDHKQFYKWALSRDFPVYISEYYMPSDFKLIYSVDKRSMLSADKSVGNKFENLYWNGVSL
jgi:site-specific DNA-adenine methylase